MEPLIGPHPPACGVNQSHDAEIQRKLRIN
jgi:hypothetical protein